MEGVGDSLCGAADRYTYTGSVPKIYHIVGRDGVKALRAKKWQEAWEAHRQQEVVRPTQEEKKHAKNWEKAKRKFDSIGGTTFNRIRAITKRNKVALAHLKCYADRNVKRNHAYDTDSSALVADSGSDDS